MPPAVAAAGIGVGGSLLSSLLGNRQSDQQKGLMTAQTNNANAQSSLAKALQSQSEGSYNLGSPAYGHALNYYSTLLNGNKAATSQAIAPQVSQLTDLYRGANRNLEHEGITGPMRDAAKADLNRQRVGQIGQLAVGVQPGAAASLGDLGARGMSAGAGAGGAASGAFSGASGGYQNLLSTLLGQNQLDFQNAFGQGSSLASLILPLLLQSQGAKQPGTLPSRQTAPTLAGLVGS